MTTRYPPAPRADLTEIINGYSVADPYRWLEDPASETTRSWLTGQDALYAEHAAALPGRESLAARLTELLGAGTVSSPAWRGERRFFMRRTPGQEHAVLYTATASGAERALIDPMQIDPSGTTTLDAWQPDKEGRLLAYQLSEGGAEESTLRILDIETGQDVDGPIDRCRYSGVACCPEARRSTTRAGCTRTPCPTARSSITAGFTCTGSARPPTKTR